MTDTANDSVLAQGLAGVPAPARWVGSATVNAADAASDPRGAVGAAVREATSGAQPKLVICFAAEHLDAQEIASGATSAAEGASVIGCSAGSTMSSSAGQETGGVVVMVLGGPGFSVATELAAYEGDAYAMGEGVASSLRRIEGEYKVLLLLPDGLRADPEEVVRGAYNVAGPAIPLVGGASGDANQFESAWEFNDGQVTRGVVGAAIGSSAPLGVGIAHGWEPLGEPVLVTRSKGMDLLELDNQPALEVWAERSGTQLAEARRTGTAERIAVTRPLGLMRGDRIEVRTFVGVDFERGSLRGVTPISEGEYAWVMKGEADSVIASTNQAVTTATQTFGDATPLGLLAFGCCARSLVVGPDRLAEEVCEITAAAPDIPMIGFHTFGEIARTSGSRGFHNQTLVVLAIC